MRALSFLLVGMFLVLFTLQLCEVIAWSWWWVAAPLLIWVGIPLTILALVLPFAFSAWAFSRQWKKSARNLRNDVNNET